MAHMCEIVWTIPGTRQSEINQADGERAAIVLQAEGTILSRFSALFLSTCLSCLSVFDLRVDVSC